MAKKKSIKDRPVLGIDLGGTKILAAVISPGGKIEAQAKMKTKGEGGPEAVIERMIKCAGKAIAASGVSASAIAAAGVGAPGPLDPDTGVIIETFNMPGWKQIPLAEKLKQGLNVPVFIDNDVNVGTLGEFLFGAAKGSRHAVGVFVGTGIGGGVIIDGDLYHGFNKNAGEIGHMIVLADGPRCGCGRKGCYEALASRTAIIRDIREKAGEGKGKSSTRDLFLSQKRVSSGDLRKCVQRGDDMVIKTLKRAARYLGIGFGSLINLFSPEVIIVGGGVTEALGEEFLEEARASAQRYALPMAGDNVRILPAALGDNAGILGAAALAWRRGEP